MSDLHSSENLAEKLRDIARTAQMLEQQISEIDGLLSAEQATGQRLLTANAARETAEAAGPLVLTDDQRLICERVLNVFETGSIAGRYGAISIYRDGPGQIRQITYGRSQTTEYGNLKELIDMYAGAGGAFSAALRPYVPRIGNLATPLTDDAVFKDLLRRAGNEDSVMRRTQDQFFDRRYFRPALRWAGNNGFRFALSALVIYDSYIQSGSIRNDLRQRFSERPPAQGGREEVWVEQYVEVRHDWLANNSNPDVRPSAYRTRDLLREIRAKNWDLSVLPIMANGVAVNASRGGNRAMAAVLAAGEALSTDAEDELEWSELEPPGYVLRGMADAAQAGETPAALAQRILDLTRTDPPRITLATRHVSGVDDDATARRNIEDTAAGRPAHRSSYGTAPGGTVALDPAMLRGLLALADTYRFGISEICGGSHSTGSRHYRGVTADLNTINDQHVSAAHPAQAAFRATCRSLGATQVLGPGDPGHATHIHAAWP